MKIHATAMIAMVLFVVDASATESWVLSGLVLGYRNGCGVSYNWRAEPVFHNASDSDRNIAIVHQSGTASLPPSLTLPAGASMPLSRFVGGPSLGISVLAVETPSDVSVEPRLEYESILPCSGIPPALGPSGKISLPIFHLIDAQQAQAHYGLDLGIQSVRVNVGVYNAGIRTATATILLRRPSCNNSTTTLVPVPGDTFVQVPVPVPAICDTPVNPSPHWIVNASVVVDQPSFSYATTVSNVGQPIVTFGVGTQ